ncbi:CRISPR-associated helicase Cas3' [Calditerricola satsumensis]|uniref:CRISPR-associated helicase/endonuclease Cas3 n=1 Tax=Calditerricola satsumensis TaxID=373054 RepID=A0A8J3FBL4_9BACI|nr:CRISPR-associated helicase Cas3' [Calditerricola satsumensis]GGK05316.1 CRISPR-associated helicase/endonuclease Cas3 [Calditerricola satsumensis]
MRASLREAFPELTGVSAPHPFQIEAAERLLAGENVILSAPTGSGKTWTAVFPFLYAKQRGLPFADRLIYLLPLRTLARTLYETVRRRVEALGLPLSITIQTGSQPEDPLFEGDIVFATIDQALSAYVGLALSVGRSSANLVPGAFLGAYIVMDELHLLEPDVSLATFLDMVDRLKPYSRFLAMTATVPADVLAEMARRTGAAVKVVSGDEARALPAVGTVERRYEWAGVPLTPEEVVREHLGQRGVRKTLVIANTVPRAQALYRGVREALAARECRDEVLLLHSRFLPSDRAAKEAALLAALRDPDRSVLVVATQVIEVGLDVSAPLLLTELCPANALLQRAGRCARYPGQRGRVRVYALPRDAQGREEAAPYAEAWAREAMARTKAYLEARCPFFADEHTAVELVNRAHGELDCRRLEQVPETVRRNQVDTALASGEMARLRQLVRDVDSVSVIVRRDPQAVDLSRQVERFSLPTSALRGLVARLGVSAGRWVHGLVVREEGDADGSREPLAWEPVKRPDEVAQHVLLCLHPDVAAYDSDVGLVLGEPGGFETPDGPPKPELWHNAYAYCRETYAEHVAAVRRLYQAQAPRVAVAHERLAAQLGVTPEALEAWGELVAALHDVGKLTQEVADRFWRYQRERRGEEPTDFLAHTDYDPRNPDDRAARARMGHVGHAVEGAYISQQMILERVRQDLADPDLARECADACLTAIARHHSAWAREIRQPFTLMKEALPVAVKTLRGLGLPRAAFVPYRFQEAKRFYEHLVMPHNRAWLLYWYLVRRLRLADRQSQAEKGGKR